MSAARYVGRVGGLAVALGVGSVIVIGGGIAYADTATSGTPGVSHDTSSSAPPAGQNKSEKVKKPKASKVVKAAKVPKAPKAKQPAALTAVPPNPKGEVSAPAVEASPPAAPAAGVASSPVQTVPTATKPRVGSTPTGPVQSPGAWVLLAAARRELGIDRSLSVTPTSAVGPTTLVSPTAAGPASALAVPGPVVEFDDGIIHGSIGTPLSGPVTYSVLGGSPGKVRMLKTGDFTYLPNYADVTSGTPEQFKVRVTQQTPFVTALKQIPLIGSMAPNLLVNLRQIPGVSGLLAPLIGASVVVPVDVDLAQLVPAGTPVAYTYKIASFDGTPISVNFFPAMGLEAGEVAPTVLYGPGMTRPGETNPYATGFVGIGTFRSADYNVVTWDPRGEYASGGLLQLDNPNFEGKDVSSIISWMADSPVCNSMTPSRSIRDWAWSGCPMAAVSSSWRPPGTSASTR